MTFHLTESEIQAAFDAIEYHGYSALMPTPPEWSVFRSELSAIKTEIAQIDLDTYQPCKPLRIYAPKSRATVRVVSLLHPIDLLIYTALTLAIKSDIEAARQPVSKKISFSYRSDLTDPGRLYLSIPSFSDFKTRLDRKSSPSSVKYIAIADIADFYPRIYQHRLENAVESAATVPRTKDIARVLVKKLIGNLSGNNSYGIPVGPYASRLLAEAVLIDVDSYLISEGYDFIRWVDDYYFFTRSEQDSQEILIRLAQRLYEKHGLTLSSLKTKIQEKNKFRERFSSDVDESVDERIRTIRGITARLDPYDGEDVELTAEEIVAVTQLGLAELLEEALEDRDLINYEAITSLLRHPEIISNLPVQSRKDLADILLNNMEHLYPIAADVSRFFSRFADNDWRDRQKVRRRLLKSIEQKKGRWPPEYYVMWILSIFSTPDVWRDAPDYAKIFRDHRSDIIKRMAAIAIAANGSRAGALETKDSFESVSRITQLSILLASHRLGKDERKHWRASLQLTGILEKKI